MPVQSTSLNHYLHEVPKNTASRLRCKALALNTLEKISWIAFVAIMATIFTLSYAGMSLTGSLPMILVGMALFSPLLGIGAAQFNACRVRYMRRAEIEEGVAAELSAIAGWGTREIEGFFREHNLRLDRVPLNVLRQKNSAEPLRALLPLIARFRFLHRLEVDAEMASRNLLTQRGNGAEDEQQRVIRLAIRQFAYKKHELEAIPRGLDAAILLQLIENPNMELSVGDIGTFRAKGKDERQFDRDEGHDEYFVFHSNLNRRPITLREIDADMAPRTLRLKLFPSAAG
jgi:hypothetical protein